MTKLVCLEVLKRLGLAAQPVWSVEMMCWQQTGAAWRDEVLRALIDLVVRLFRDMLKHKDPS